MRTFIALDFSEEVKLKMGSIQKKLRQNSTKGSWTYIDNFHITLKFLGTTNPQNLDDIKTIMGDIAKKNSPLKISLDNLGFFPGKDSIRVVWIDIKGDVEQLKGINYSVEKNLGSLGIKKESRQYMPHITLGRSVVFDNTLYNVKDIFEKEKPYDFTINSISLMSSENIDNKRIYTPIATFKLAGK